MGCRGHGSQEGPLGQGTMALALGPSWWQLRGVGGPQMWGVSLGTNSQISSIIVINLIWGFACVIPANHGLILLRAAAGSCGQEDGAELMTPRNRWDADGFEGGQWHHQGPALPRLP